MPQTPEEETSGPPTPPPTFEQLKVLPRWARVAYAVRALRRVQPLTPRRSILVDRSASEFVEELLNATEAIARQGSFGDPIHTLQVVREFRERHQFRPGPKGVPDIIEAAVNVFGASCMLPTEPHYWDDSLRTMVAAVQICEKAAYIRSHTSSSGQPGTSKLHDFVLFSQALWRDRSLLLECSTLYEWTDNSAVDLDLLGPYWHDGEPEWWQEEQLLPGDATPVLSLEIALPDEMDAENAAGALGKVIEGASQLHIAMGGTGLRFHGPPVSFEPAGSLVPSGDDDWKGGGR